jgi:hypothetical protein
MKEQEMVGQLIRQGRLLGKGPFGEAVLEGVESPNEGFPSAIFFQVFPGCLADFLGDLRAHGFH